VAARAATVRSPLTGRKLRIVPARVNRDGVRPQAIYGLPLTIRERRELEKIDAEIVRFGIDRRRPRTLAQCPPDEEPCPFVSCRHHLALEVMPRTGKLPAVRLTFPDKDLSEMDETCSHRVARRTAAKREELSIEETARMLNITGERCRQLEKVALAKVRAALDDDQPA